MSEKTEIQELEERLDDAEEALREIFIMHGYPDPADSEGVSPKEIQNAVKRRVISLAENVRAYGRHSATCTQKPDGLVGDCDCGLLLVLEELEKLPSFA